MSRSSRFLDFMTLMTSMSTLFCCALPALFVALGAGSVFAGLVGRFPQFIWFSENKEILFFVSGTLIIVSGFLLWRNRNAPCPIDPELAKKCTRTRKFSVRIYFASFFLYLLGGLFAYLLPIFMES